ncbi:MAG: hypothetical protein IKS65_10570 [Bacteroidales bacterium]|nr:hypothetical protein [Bacteroidales bacterium]
MKKVFIIGLALITILTSCATILSGTKAKVTVSTSTGEPATIRVDGRTYNVNGPTRIQVNRGFKSSKIEAENANSYGSIDVNKKFNATTLWNLLLGGIPGFVVDGVSGAMGKPVTDMYTIYMQAKNNQPKKEEPKKEEPKEKVQGLGTTSLEQTIIRWDIQSRPQGADIFWRVVSKTPEVKSTNNKYLMTTPYEATKAIDIKGLTYQTSSNVRIILRCEKDGYMPQEKEFDVRMVIDQEEISAFFRLVKEE